MQSRSKPVGKKAKLPRDDVKAPPALDIIEEPKPKRVRTSSVDASAATVYSAPKIAPGTVVTGRLMLAPPPKFRAPLGCVVVQFSTPEHSQVFGKVDITDLADKFESLPMKKLRNGQFVKCVVLKPAPCDKPVKFVEVSMRASLMQPEQDVIKLVEQEYVDRFETTPKVEDNVVHEGFIVSSTKMGCFVRVNRALTPRVLLKCLAHDFVNDVEQVFPDGKLVRGKFTSMTTEGKVEMDLRVFETFSLSDITSGLVLEGKVEKVIAPGVLVRLTKTGAVGLCHYSECFDEVPHEIANRDIAKGEVGIAYRPLLATHFPLGSKVKCLVLNVDADTLKIGLGMKPQYFTKGDDVDMEEEEEEEANEDEEEAEEEEEEEGEEEEAFEVAEAKPTISLQQAMKEIGVKAKPVVIATAPTSDNDDEDDEDGSDEEGDRATRNLNSKRRDAIKRKAEQATALLENRIVEDSAPNSADEFERVLVSNKTSSLVWIQYLSFLLNMGEPIAKARAVAKRALDSIGPMLETEFQNVFSAWLALEIAFGTSDTFTAVFKDMTKRCDEEWAHLTMVKCLIESKLDDKKVRIEEAFKKAKRATKQQSTKVWIKEFEYFFFEVNNANQARVVFKEAIRLAQKNDTQIELMLAFAKLEFQHDSTSDRGPQIFEKLLETRPKRVDFWNVYVDLQVKYQALDKARELFGRVLLLKLSAKKMKSFFKKWLELENEHGTEEQVELVKQRARDYVEQL
ncbi:hypothetical protein BASA81_000132 [Batrachochytrium salamandrivorans]|nr:hypothetical protein BASA81_000132 [Batrachochytrium salamandrivorans]